MVAQLSDEYEKITEKARFIKMVVDGELVVFKRSKADIVRDITAFGFNAENGYNHLLDIRIHSFTLEKYNELMERVKTISHELCALKDKTTAQQWKDDLDCLREIN